MCSGCSEVRRLLLRTSAYVVQVWQTPLMASMLGLVLGVVRTVLELCL